MKKLVVILLAMVVGFTTKAQVYNYPLAAGDTVVNTAAVSKAFAATGHYKGITVNPKYTKISGTVAGTIKLQASFDGTVWIDVASQTASATDVASNQFIWYVAAPLAPRYRVLWTGTGTMSAVLGLSVRFNQ